MARPLRIEYAEAWYHVMNRGRRKENIFFCEDDYRLFMKVLGECSKLFNLKVHAYSLMQNHYHLLVHTPKGNLSRSMRHLNGVYTQKINRKHKKEGSLLKGRFKSILIEQESYLLEIIRYIHRNPYEAGIEKHIGEHKWTSHHVYMRKSKRPVWLEVKEVLLQFSEHEGRAERGLDAFVKKEMPEELKQKLNGLKWPAVFGGKEFKEMVSKKLSGRKMDAREVPQYKKNMEKISVDKIINKIEKSLELESGFFRQKHTRTKLLKRRACIYIFREYLQIPCREICMALGDVSFAAISKHYLIARDEVKKKQGCFQDVEGILHALKLNS